MLSGEPWELWHCRNAMCGAGPWRVQPWPREEFQPDVERRWWVARPGQPVPWTESGMLPFCPLCASDLHRGARREDEPSPT